MSRIETHTAAGYAQAAASILNGEDPDCSPQSQHSPAWDHMPMPDHACPECGREGPGWCLSDTRPMPAPGGLDMDQFWGSLIGQAMQRRNEERARRGYTGGN